IAGIVRGASEGEGLGNQFLANIREADAICQVTRAFADPDVVHVDGKVDPASDIETITTELALADIQTLEKQIPRLEKEVRGKKVEALVLETARAALELLEAGTVLSGPEGAELDQEALRSFQLMTAKPFIYVFNMDEAGMGDQDVQAKLRELVAPAEAIFLDAEFEAELVELDPEDAKEMLEDSGQSESGMDKLARAGFETLGLQTFLTAGPKESRAWTIHRGDTAPEAAGVIHTDFQKGFIKAEIVSYDDLVEYGSMAEARAHGRVRMEGKDYVMQDGDIVEFRFNV
ncbi:MAG: redox-regulated ATPase YchF, partial [Actinomyces sp.]|nr:redox-regulated ATPase YchF [Actinomyces sp.]